MSIEPIYFIIPDVELYFKHDFGKVKQINSIGFDDKGTYVSCKITYNKKITDFITNDLNEKIYSKDFENDESENSWKFTPHTSLIIKYLIESNKEFQSLKLRLDAQEILEDTDEDEETESEEESEEETESEELDKPVVIIEEEHEPFWITTSKVMLNLGLSTLCTLLSFKIFKDITN